MKLKRFKEKDNKRIGIIVFTIICILLVCGAVLYRTFAIFEVKTNQNVINGTVQDPGDIYFAFYVDNNIQKDMPQKNSGYILDEENSYCGVTGENDSTIEVSLTENWELRITGVTSSRTKCNLKFVKGAFILGKPVKAVTTGNGLYEIPHGNEVTGTTNDIGFKQTEWRFAGKSPNNYVTFNEENWRIIGLVNVMTSENEVEQRVKIVKDDSIGDIAWDSAKKNDWTNASLRQLLNEDYYTRSNDYSSNGLLENSRLMVDNDTIWNLGSVDQNLYGRYQLFEWYNVERGKNVYSTNPYLWKDGNKVGLIYASDYMYAIDGEMKDTCKTSSLYTDNLCYTQNWLYKDVNSATWTIVTYQNLEYSSLLIHSNDIISNKGMVAGGGSTGNARSIYPTLYLKSNVKITSGKGEENNPFKITLMIE